MMKGYYNNPIDGGEHVREQLSDYMDGLLSGEERQAVRLHLEECAGCRADYIELRATHKAMQSMPTLAVPRTFTLTPEMAGRVRRPSFWEALFVHRNAPRLAAGSLVAFLLLAIFIGNDFLGKTGSPDASTVSSEQNPIASSMAAPEPSAATAAGAADQAQGQARIATEPTQQPSAKGSSIPAAPVAPEAAPTTGTAAPTPSGAETNPAVPPDTAITASGNSSPTTTTLEGPAAGGAPGGAYETHVTPAPASTNNVSAGWLALQAGLFVVALGLGAAAVIAWRRH